MSKDATSSALVVSIADKLDSIIRPESPYHAGLIEELKHAVVSGDMIKSQRLFCSLEFWGGSGSIADLLLSERSSNRRKIVLLSKLVWVLREAGIDCPAATQMAQIYDSWIAEGIYD